MEGFVCGDCKHFDRDLCSCSVKHSVFTREWRDACNLFEECSKMTNGDKIRQMSNEELAEYFIYESGAMFASTLIVDKTFDTFNEAIEATMEYLNAPAESKVEE